MAVNYGKSLNDSKNYRLVQLESGLKALLVSKEKLHNSSSAETKSAAALAVQIGSYSDPLQLEGCAHFLEHMIFMGSEKYPAENEYDSYVSTHDGSCNAFTEGEYTIYQFEVAAEAFEKSLDIFAQCFISPLLTKESMEREIEAIESEFKLAQMDDESRLQQIMSYQVCENHCLNKFSWGNKRSLLEKPKSHGVDSYEVLKWFYSTFYVPENMTLSLVSSVSLDSMEALVRRSFQFRDTSKLSIKKQISLHNQLSIDQNVVRDSTPFQRKELLNLTRLSTIKNTNKLVIVWSLPSFLSDYQNKSHHYISHILGHEGPGSLLSLLKSADLADDVCAGVSDSNFDESSFHTFFTVTFRLTENGLINWILVVQHLMSYINMLKTNPPDYRIYDEYKRVAELSYRFMDEEQPEDLSERLSKQLLPMFQYKEKDILSGPFLYFEWNPEAIRALLETYFNVETAKFYLMSRAFDSERGREGRSRDRKEGEDDDDDDEDEDEDDSEEDEEDDEDSDLSGEEDEEEEGEEEEDECNAASNSDPLSEENIHRLYRMDSSWMHLVKLPEGDSSEEPHFNVKFWNDEIPRSLYEFWRSANSSAAAFPPVNEFIATNLDLIHQHRHDVNIERDNATAVVGSVDFESVPEPVSKRACLESCSEGYEDSDKMTPRETRVVGAQGKSNCNLWVLEDTRFKMPKVEICIQIDSSFPSANQPLHFVAIDYIAMLTKDFLTQDLYMASMAGLFCELSVDRSTYVLKVTGFSERSTLLVVKTISALLSPLIFSDIQRHSRVREQLKKHYENKTVSSRNVVSQGRLAILMQDEIPFIDKLQTIQENDLPPAELDEFQRNFMRNAHIHCLVQGNKTTEDSTALAENISKQIIAYSTSTSITTTTAVATPAGVCDYSISGEVLEVPVASSLVVHQAPTSAKEKNVGVEVYFQVGATNVLDLTLLELLEILLYEPLFDQLRTKQQMGYDVSCGMRETKTMLGFCFRIVSSSHSVVQIVEKLLQFAVHASDLIKGLQDEHIESSISSLLASKKQPDVSLAEAAQRNWAQIETRTFDFNIKQKQIALISEKKVNKEIVREFAKNAFVALPRIIVSLASIDSPNLKQIGKIIKTEVKNCKTIRTLSHPREIHR